MIAGTNAPNKQGFALVGVLDCPLTRAIPRGRESRPQPIHQFAAGSHNVTPSIRTRKIRGFRRARKPVSNTGFERGPIRLSAKRPRLALRTMWKTRNSDGGQVVKSEPGGTCATWTVERAGGSRPETERILYMTERRPILISLRVSGSRRFICTWEALCALFLVPETRPQKQQ